MSRIYNKTHLFYNNQFYINFIEKSHFYNNFSYFFKQLYISFAFQSFVFKFIYKFKTIRTFLQYIKASKCTCLIMLKTQSQMSLSNTPKHQKILQFIDMSSTIEIRFNEQQDFCREYEIFLKLHKKLKCFLQQDSWNIPLYSLCGTKSTPKQLQKILSFVVQSTITSLSVYKSSLFEGHFRQIELNTSAIQKTQSLRINFFQSISRISFVSLKEICLQNINLCTIQDIQFLDMRIQKLNLGKNNICSIKSLRKSNFPQLKKLNLSQNYIKDMYQICEFNFGNLNFSKTSLQSLKIDYDDPRGSYNCNSLNGNLLTWIFKLQIKQMLTLGNSLSKVERTRISNMIQKSQNLILQKLIKTKVQQNFDFDKQLKLDQLNSF